MTKNKGTSVVTTGIAGLNDILGGGLPNDRFYLIEGEPGAGKTTTALQFLMAARDSGNRSMYITLSETRDELEQVAASHGWSLDGIEILDLGSARESLISDMENTMFQPAEVELKQTVEYLLSEIERVNPARLVLDSLSELRLLAQNDLRFRRQILSLKQFFVNRSCTVLLLDESFTGKSNFQVQSIVHGVITLSNLPPEYGAERRRLIIKKLRGTKYRGGYHDFAIRTGGVTVFPRLVAAEHRNTFEPVLLSSGIRGLDDLLNGGVHSGSSTLLLGPAGTGKSSIIIQFIYSAAQRGQKSSIYLFDETVRMYLNRAKGLNLDLAPFVKKGIVQLTHVDPAELSPGELVDGIRNLVEQQGVGVIVIDSLNGYLYSMPGERYLILQLHELLTYLNHKGVVTFLVLAQQGLIGNVESQADLTYLSDTVLILRHFESFGEVLQAISVIKKRSGDHERTLRQVRVGKDGISVGLPLKDFHGVLSGVPVYSGDDKDIGKDTPNKKTQR